MHLLMLKIILKLERVKHWMKLSKLYEKLVFGGQGNFSDISSGEHKTITATIDRLGMSQTDGNTYYTIILKEHPELLLMGSGTISLELPISREGDQVTIEYIDAKNKTKTIVSFDNLSFDQ